ncbi:SPRY domain-containing protein [Dyella sp. 20L07]|uniref:SPRY domain-containing protein n=1 Tax=Dyella sp. 20L07 TaxID=3384240 RepID=UPI003D2878FC
MMPSYAIWSSRALGTDLTTEQSGTVLSARDVIGFQQTGLALQPQSVGRWYVELLLYGDDPLVASVGVVLTNTSLATYVGGDATGYGYRLAEGQIHHAGVSVANAAVASKGDTIGVLLDLTQTQPTVTWYRNGLVVATCTLPSIGPWALATSLGTTTAYGLRCFLNAGQRAFEYAPQGIDGWYEPLQSVRGLRVASEDWLSDPVDEVPNQRYEGLLSADTGELRAVRSLDFWPWQRGIKSGAMTMTLLDPDNAFDELLTGDGRDLSVRIGAIAAGAAYASRKPLYTAILDSIAAIDDLSVRLTCRDPLGLLDVPLQRRLIRPNADVSAANQPWPVMIGACRNVPVVLLDAATLTYAVSDAQVLGVGYCRDKGYPLDPAAAPADFTLGPDKTTIKLHSQPQGKVTIDLSSVGGDQLPAPSDDILAGAGNPFTGSEGAAPDGFDNVGGDVPQAAPRLNGGVLEFPLVQTSPTIHASMPIYTNGLVGQGAIRISWLDANGLEVGLSDGARLSGSNAWAIHEVIDTAPASAVRARIEVAAYNHTGGIIRTGTPTAEYVLYGDHDVIGLSNGSFENGFTDWSATTLGWVTTEGYGVSGSGVKFNGLGVSELRNDGVAPVTPGQRITAKAYIALDTRGGGHPSGELLLKWLDASDNLIGQVESATVVTGNRGRFGLVTVTGTAPVGAVYAKFGLAANGVGSDPSGTLFDECSWDYVLEPVGGQRVAIPLPDLTHADGWQLEAGWSLQPPGSNGYGGAAYAEHAAGGAGATSAMRSTTTSNVRQAVAYAGWAGITAAKLGAGASYKVAITITDMPDDGQSYIGLATGKTLDTMLASWKKPGTYTVTVTNTDGVDHDLYLLSIPLSSGEGTVPVSPSIGAIQIIHYDDSYTPDPRSTEPVHLQAIKLADCLHELLDVRAAQQGLTWSRADAEGIDDDAGYAGIGLYLQGGETVRQALDLVLPSYTACSWADAAGTLRFTRLIAPESIVVADRAGTIDINALSADLVPTFDTAPGLSTQMGVRRNWAGFADGDLVEASTNFPLSVRQGALQSYQLNVSTAAQLSGAYRHALYATPAASCFDSQVDGQAEIDRIGRIYTVPRWFYTLQVELDALPGIDLGQVWTLVYPKYGLANGKAVLVIDFEPDLLANTAQIIVWG